MRKKREVSYGSDKFKKKDSFGDFPKEVGPVVKNLPCRDFHLPMQGTWVRSLVGELRSHVQESS